MLDRIHTSIRKSLSVFLVSFIVSIICVLTSFFYMESLRDQDVQAKRSMQTWKGKIDFARENNSIIVDYEQPYLQLKSDAVVGDENRLSWFETLQATSNSRSLDTFKFSTNKQIKIRADDLNQEYRDLDVYRSVIRLEMMVSHEGDIFAVFNDLDENAKGLYGVDSCEIAKRGTEPQQSLGVVCELSWYTMRRTEG